MTHLAAIILAAGKGTRIHATKDRNKVAYHLGSRPMICYTLDHLLAADIHEIVAVIGFAADSVRQALGASVTYAVQSKRLGTGHAVKTGLKVVSQKADTIITMYGDDSAFYPPALFTTVVKSHLSQQADISVVTIKVDNPTGLGRILRDPNGQMIGIVEEKVATKSQKLITEINTGLFCFNRQFLVDGLAHLPKNPISQEYYLTDIIYYCLSCKGKLNPIIWPDNQIWHGVNTRAELAQINQIVAP
jgi:bifunctional UDP-N-acetylglucosamine pyrophosphorylase/glucosamine-1-phosphate N-acetyltransferase